MCHHSALTGDETARMARRWVLSAIVAAVLVVAAVFAARAIRDDDASDRATSATTTSSGATSTTGAASTSAAPSTTTSPTGGPATTAVTSPATPPGPCTTQLEPIKTAVFAGVPGAQGASQVASCRLAASDATWAAAQLTSSPGSELNGRIVILHDDAGAWTVVANGGTNAGCGQAPQQVIADLGQFCAGSGGSSQ